MAAPECTVKPQATLESMPMTASGDFSAGTCQLLQQLCHRVSYMTVLDSCASYLLHINILTSLRSQDQNQAVWHC